jgi:excisionase family DNA binding protein
MDLDEVADILSMSQAQVYVLVRRGELPAIRIRGRGLWRVERVELERFIRGVGTNRSDP